MMKHLRTIVVSFAALVAPSLLSHAATISILEPETPTKSAVIKVTGDFIVDDDRTFGKIALQFDQAVVVFDSDGGNLSAGIGIGKAIRLRQYRTIVQSGSTCASACALAWLGGVRRYMDNGAKVGFHAAYRDENGRLQESGIANALVGSYLNQLGLAENAIGYVTHAAPDAIQWLTLTDAIEVGIHIENSSSTENLPIQSDTSQPTTDAPPAENMRFASGVDLFGYDLPNMPLRKIGWNGCISACSASSECKAVTFNSKSDTCFMKSSADISVYYAPATSAFSAELEGKIKKSALRILQRTDVQGGDYAHLDNIGMEGCLRRCDADEACKAFTFIAKKNQCWLKSVTGPTLQKSGVVSGVK